MWKLPANEDRFPCYGPVRQITCLLTVLWQLAFSTEISGCARRCGDHARDHDLGSTHFFAVDIPVCSTIGS